MRFICSSDKLMGLMAPLMRATRKIVVLSYRLKRTLVMMKSKAQKKKLSKLILR